MGKVGVAGRLLGGDIQGKGQFLFKLTSQDSASEGKLE